MTTTLSRIGFFWLSLCAADFFEFMPGVVRAQSTAWEPSGGPVGETITAVCFDSNGTLHAGTNLGSILRSTDEGNSWTVRAKISSVRNLTVLRNGSVYAGLAFSGALRSTDHGDSWGRVDSGMSTFSVAGFAEDNSGYIYAAADNGVFRSTNRGRTWSHTSSSLSYPSGVTATSDSALFISSEVEGIFKSTDRGMTWKEADSGFITKSVIALCSDSAGVLFAGTFDYGMYRSTNRGNSWIQMFSGATTPSLCFTPAGDMYLVATNYGVYRSTNRGDTWRRTASPTIDPRSLVPCPSGHILAVGWEALYRSEDSCQTWHWVWHGTVYSWVSAISGTCSGVLLAATDAGVFRSVNRGDSWISVNLGLTNLDMYSLTVSQEGVTLAGDVEGSIWRSTDLGDSWINVRPGPTFSMNAFLFAPGDTVFAGSRGNSLFLSTDLGLTWQTAKGTFPVDAVSCIVRGVDNTIYVGLAQHGVYASTDDGKSWNPPPDSFGTQKVVSLAVGPSDEIFAGTRSSGVFRTLNHGATWSPTGPELGTTWARALAVSGRGDIYAATNDKGVYVSTNAGNTWVDFNSGLNGNPLSASLYQAPDGYLYEGSGGAPIYRTTHVTKVREQKSLSVNAIWLSQNYPNPFNPSTTIRYALPTRVHVTLSVFNTLGQQVAILVNGSQEVGYHDARFDASGLASGVYFYRLQAGDFVQTKRLMILR